MAKGFESFRRLLIAVVATAAVLQWVVVLEGVWAAVWAWYKFFGYGGGGHIVVGTTTQVVFLLGSGVFAVAGHVLSKVELSGSRAWRNLAQFGWSSIAVCTLLWVFLLASPLVAFRRT